MATKKAKTKPTFSITLKQGSESVTGKGKTILEALESVVKPLKIVSKCVLTISDGKKSVETLLMPVRAKRLFFPNAQLYIAKQLEFLLK